MLKSFSSFLSEDMGLDLGTANGGSRMYDGIRNPRLFSNSANPNKFLMLYRGKNNHEATGNAPVVARTITVDGSNNLTINGDRYTPAVTNSTGVSQSGGEFYVYDDPKFQYGSTSGSVTTIYSFSGPMGWSAGNPQHLRKILWDSSNDTVTAGDWIATDNNPNFYEWEDIQVDPSDETKVAGWRFAGTSGQNKNIIFAFGTIDWSSNSITWGADFTLFTVNGTLQSLDPSAAMAFHPTKGWVGLGFKIHAPSGSCHLYTSDTADDLQ